VQARKEINGREVFRPDFEGGVVIGELQPKGIKLFFVGRRLVQ
jgi:hypothetical protein